MLLSRLQGKLSAASASLRTFNRIASTRAHNNCLKRNSAGETQTATPSSRTTQTMASTNLDPPPPPPPPFSPAFGESGTTIFTVMSQLSSQHNCVNLGQVRFSPRFFSFDRPSSPSTSTSSSQNRPPSPSSRPRLPTKTTKPGLPRRRRTFGDKRGRGEAFIRKAAAVLSCGWNPGAPRCYRPTFCAVLRLTRGRRQRRRRRHCGGDGGSVGCDPGVW